MFRMQTSTLTYPLLYLRLIGSLLTSSLPCRTSGWKLIKIIDRNAKNNRIFDPSSCSFHFNSSSSAFAFRVVFWYPHFIICFCENVRANIKSWAGDALLFHLFCLNYFCLLLLFCLIRALISIEYRSKPAALYFLWDWNRRYIWECQSNIQND